MIIVILSIYGLRMYCFITAIEGESSGTGVIKSSLSVAPSGSPNSLGVGKVSDVTFSESACVPLMGKVSLG